VKRRKRLTLTPGQERGFRRRYLAGEKYAELAAWLGVPLSVAFALARRLGLPRRNETLLVSVKSVRKPARADEPRTRACLMCTEPFTSRHLGERVCGDCKASAAWQAGCTTAYAVATPRRAAGLGR
jgi:hypothetical protein